MGLLCLRKCSAAVRVAHQGAGDDQLFADCPGRVTEPVAHTLQGSPLLIHGTHQPNLAAGRGVVPEDDTAFLEETSEPLVSKTDLPGHGFQRPAGSVSGFRSLKKVVGGLRCLPWLASPALRSVPSSADRLVHSHHLNRRRGKFRQAFC